MDILNFLQQMARSTHHDVELNQLINNQPLIIQDAYRENNSNLLKKYLGESQYIANPSDVTYLTT